MPRRSRVFCGFVGLRRNGGTWRALPPPFGLVACATTLVAAALVVGAISGRAAAAPGEDTRPIPNPDLTAACGIDIAMILDRSGSIASSGATQNVRDAFKAFTSALKNTGSRLAVADFSTVARLPIGSNYITVTDATIAGTFDPYINGFNPSGSTNWEDGFRVGRYFLPRPSQTTPHLVVFITDGDPNEIIRDDRVTFDPGNPNVAENEYELKVPLDSNEVTSADNTLATRRAVPNANALKAAGSHILAVAVGAGLNSQASLNRIIDVSGPDVFSGIGTFNISTDDVYRQPDFSQLAAALRTAAFALCAPSVNVRKLTDENPDPAVDDLQPGQGWSMTANASPTPPSWVLPPGATGSTATGTTSADGFVTFQWRTAASTASSSVTVTEVVQPGYVNDPAATTCTYRTPDQPTDQPLPGFSATTGGFGGTVPKDSIVICQMVNRRPPAPAVDLEKATNGDDADTPPGPFVPIGSTVTWTYRVTNTGNVPLTGIAVSDNQPGVTVSCPVSTLGPGDSTTCTATGTGIAGQYSNTGTVTATGAGTQVTASDPSNYFGVAPGIDIEKATNGVDADQPPGPFIPVGGAVNWTYVVTNTGNAALTGVAVTDSQGVTVTCPQTTLAIGASMTCTAPAAVAVAGQYGNVGSVTATSPTGPVQDSDASHYFGEAPAVNIEKLTNLQDADAPPGPQIAVGGRVTWSYLITNTGNVPLSWSLSDPQAPFLFCPRLFLIVPGQTIACYSQSTAVAGQYENTGTVVGTSPSGQQVSDSDPSHYFGVQGGIDIEKFTNEVDADKPPGPFIPVGAPITWRYHVTNTGNTDLTNVQVSDVRVVLRGIFVICPQTTLAAGASMDCTATGLAQADQYTNLATARGETPLGDVVQDLDPSNYFGAAPGIHLEKDTNGVDADEAPGPYIPVGDPVDWTYIVTNSGNVAVSGITVTDNRGVAVTCPGTTLAPGAEMTCTASGTAQLGQYANVGTVTATAGEGGTLTDTDPSHYFGFRSLIHIEKLTNGEDADAAPGPSVAVGSTVTWTYRVTNPGNVAIRTVTVTDDRGVTPIFAGGDADGNGDLDPGETWLYTASGTAAEGQYANTGTVTGLDILENPVSDSDPSHYTGTTTPSPTPPPPTPTPPPPPPPPPPGMTTVQVVKNWLRARTVTTIYVDRDGRAPYDASARADSNGDQTSFAFPVSTQVTVGEVAIPRGYTATINCGSGARPYTGGPFTLTTPSQAGATLRCTIVNRAPAPAPPPPKPKPKPKPTPKPKPQPVLVVDKSVARKVIRTGQSVRFVITVRNRGRGPATNVIVCDRPADGLVFRRARGARFNNGDACWRVARLGARRSTSFAVRVASVRVQRRTLFVNVATVTSGASCPPRTELAAERTGAVCRALARVAVLPARVEKQGGGVTG